MQFFYFKAYRRSKEKKFLFLIGYNSQTHTLKTIFTSIVKDIKSLTTNLCFSSLN